MSVDSLFFRFEARHQQLEAPGRDEPCAGLMENAFTGSLFDTKRQGRFEEFLSLRDW